SRKLHQLGHIEEESLLSSTNFLLAMIFCRSMLDISVTRSRAKTRSEPDQHAQLKTATANPWRRSEVFTLMLLNDCARGSEQLPITHNKKRLPSAGWRIAAARADFVHILYP